MKKVPSSPASIFLKVYYLVQKRVNTFLQDRLLEPSTLRVNI